MFKYKFLFTTLFLFALTTASAQVPELEEYDYVIVPNQFGFQKEAGEYDLNALLVFLLRKYDFDAYLNTAETPKDMNINGCNTLYAEAETSGFLAFKTQINLKDCRGRTVFQFPEGKSRVKEFKAGYQDSFRDVFRELEEMEIGFAKNDEIIAMSEIKPQTDSTSADDDMEEIIEVVETKVDKKQEKPREVIVTTIEKPVVPVKKPAPAPESTTKSMYASADGSYALKSTSAGFDVMANDKKIGTALKTSGGSYLISTTEFNGVGRFEGNTFIVEREVKGVEGLVKMTFKPQD